MRDASIARRLVFSAAIAAIFAAAFALLACGSSGNTYTSPSALSKCAVAFDAPASTLPASGGSGSLDVKTERECQWTARTDAGWLSIKSGASGQGAGTVQFDAAANADPAVRTGGIIVNDQRVQVTQAAGECRFDLSTPSASFPQAGGNGSVDVRASSPLCTWTAASDSDWIAITSGTSGKGSATVGFSVAPTSGPPRMGTLRIAGLAFSVAQSEGCTYAIEPSTYSAGAAGGSGSVSVIAGSGCLWTASSNVTWISLATTSGSGNGTVGFTVAATTGPSRTGTLTVAGRTFTVMQSPGCAFDVSPLNYSVDNTGGTRTVNVTTGAGCAWTAASQDAWITVTAGASGNGSGSVTFTAAASAGPSRTGTLSVAGKTVTVTQSQGCALSITPDTQSVPSSGGSGTVTVTVGAGCTWTSSSNVPWITIASGASGTGNGTVTFNVAATTGPARSGTLTIGGRTFTVNQGQGCAFSLSAGSGSVPASGGSGSFDVRTSDGCGWSAASNASWLTVTSGASGSGNGSVHYSAAANSGPPRTGTITAGGQTFTVTQDAGCSFTISPANQNVDSGGGNASVTVTAPAGCAWSASSNVAWISISSGSSGSGNGVVQLAVAANTDAPRNGTVTIAGQTFTVTQAGGCTYSLSPTGQGIPAAGGSGSFAVNASGTCGWTATATVPWISITSGSSGAGNGTVQFAVAANTGTSRSGTITAAGQTFTVTQDSGCSPLVAPDTIAEPSAGGSQNVSVSTTADCSWAAVSNVPWIAVSSGATGSGNGTVQLSIQANTGPARSGTATVANRTVTVNQDGGCTFAIVPASQDVASQGGSGSVTVTAGAGCAWTAVSGVAWITITSGSSGTGGGTVQFSVDANTTGAARSGTITIGGQVFTVNQAGA